VGRRFDPVNSHPDYEALRSKIPGAFFVFDQLALADVIRVGKVRERKVAIVELKKLGLTKGTSHIEYSPAYLQTPGADR
jgi:hypothetical protein